MSDVDGLLVDSEVTVNGVPSGPVTVHCQDGVVGADEPHVTVPSTVRVAVPPDTRLSRLDPDMGVMVTVQGGPVEIGADEPVPPGAVAPPALPVPPPGAVLPPDGGTEPDEPRPVPADVAPPVVGTPPVGAAPAFPPVTPPAAVAPPALGIPPPLDVPPELFIVVPPKL